MFVISLSYDFFHFWINMWITKTQCAFTNTYISSQIFEHRISTPLHYTKTLSSFPLMHHHSPWNAIIHGKTDGKSKKLLQLNSYFSTFQLSSSLQPHHLKYNITDSCNEEFCRMVQLKIEFEPLTGPWAIKDMIKTLFCCEEPDSLSLVYFIWQ